MDKITLIADIEGIIEEAYNGDILMAISKISEVLPVLAQIADTVSADKKENYTNILRLIPEAMESQDGTMLGDVLQYELLDNIDEYID